MEFQVELKGAIPDVDAIRELIRDVDPAALVDLDSKWQALRVAAHIDVIELISLIQRGGYPVEPRQVTRVPSVCCGGCSG
jgi:hypothetical protein